MNPDATSALEFKQLYNGHWKKYHIYGRWLADPGVSDELKEKHTDKFNNQAHLLIQLTELAPENIGRIMTLGEIEFGFYLSKVEL